jgi:hypothetical protein
MLQFERTCVGYRGWNEKVGKHHLAAILCLGHKETEPSRNLTGEVYVTSQICSHGGSVLFNCS